MYKNPLAPAFVYPKDYSPDERRVEDGTFEYRCSSCDQWKLEYEMSRKFLNPQSRRCRVCAGEKSAKPAGKVREGMNAYHEYLDKLTEVKGQITKAKNEYARVTVEFQAKIADLKDELRRIDLEYRSTL